MNPLPAWMLPHTAPELWRVSPLAPNLSAKSGGSRFTRRAMGSFAQLLADLLHNEAIAAEAGLLQSIDARAKLVGLLSLLVAITVVHRLPILLLAYGLCLGLAVMSKVPAKRLAQVWLTVPLFSLVILLPATLNIVTAGKPVLTLWHFATRDVAITDAGLLVAARLIVRSAIAVSLALLLTVTTPTARLFHGLRGLGVPQIFVTLLTMMTRYLSVLVRAAEEIHLAKLSRSVRAGSLRQEQAWLAAGIGSLFRRTQALGQQVYLAMLARGYTGEVHLLDEPRWKSRDWGFCLIALVVATGLAKVG